MDSRPVKYAIFTFEKVGPFNDEAQWPDDGGAAAVGRSATAQGSAAAGEG